MNALEIIGTVIVTAGGSAVIVAGVATWIGKIVDKLIVDYRQLGFEIDLDLRKRRLPVYQELWAATSLLPKWPRVDNLNYGDLAEFSKRLRSWYFHSGGLFLSQRTHKKAYSPLQEALSKLSAKPSENRVNDIDYRAIRKKCSELREYLAIDIQSRRESPLADHRSVKASNNIGLGKHKA